MSEWINAGRWLLKVRPVSKVIDGVPVRMLPSSDDIPTAVASDFEPDAKRYSLRFRYTSPEHIRTIRLGDFKVAIGAQSGRLHAIFFKHVTHTTAARVKVLLALDLIEKEFGEKRHFNYEAAKDVVRQTPALF